MEVGVRSRRSAMAGRGAGMEMKEGMDRQMEINTRKQPVVMMKRVQVVYYLTRNGQLEHPHFIELSHPPNQHLRLKDFMERLTALRGRGTHSLYSWSCKRTYKNGYVWNDLAEDDIIHPADGGAGAEFVLKGSELLLQEGFHHSDMFHQQLHDAASSTRQVAVVHNHKPTSTNLKPSNYMPIPKTKQQPQSQNISSHLSPMPPSRELELEEESPEEFEDEIEEKTNYSTSSTTPRSRCNSRVGVSTDELEDEQQQGKKQLQVTTTNNKNTKTPMILMKRFQEEDGDESDSDSAGVIKEGSYSLAGRPAGRNSALLQLISCGSFTSPLPPPKLKNNIADVAEKLRNNSNNVHLVKRKEDGSISGRKSNNMSADEEEAAAMMMIKYMSENPRFGNPQSQEKEFFSGSIVESASRDHRMAAVDDDESTAATPGKFVSIKRSNSHGEERSSLKAAASVEAEEAASAEVEKRVNKERGGCMKGKCIPRAF